MRTLCFINRCFYLHTNERGSVGTKTKDSRRENSRSEKDDDPSNTDTSQEQPLNIPPALSQTDTRNCTHNALGRRNWNGTEGGCYNRQGRSQLGRSSTGGRQDGQFVSNTLHHLVSVEEQTNNNTNSTISKNPLLNWRLASNATIIINAQNSTNWTNGIGNIISCRQMNNLCVVATICE